MNVLTNNTNWEYTPSDNLHLFGVSTKVVEGWDITLRVPMSRKECFKHIEDGDFLPFQKAGIDIFCEYQKEEKPKKGL